MWINKVTYCLIALYSLVLAILYYEPQTLYLAIILLLFPILLVLILQYLKKQIRVIVRNNSGSVLMNQPISYQMEVVNTGILPIGCIRIKLGYYNEFNKEKEYQIISLGMNSKSQQVIHFKLQSEHVGNIVMYVEQIRIYDYLRIFYRKQKSDSVTKATVFPEVYVLESDVKLPQPDFVESDVFSKIKPGDDPTEVFDIREYKPGDKVHRIHWKLSTKIDTMMVKEYSLPIACTVAILVDTSYDMKKENLSYMDTILASVSSLSYTLCINEQRHSICWYDESKEELIVNIIESMEDMYVTMQKLVELEWTSNQESRILDAYQVYGDMRSLTKVFYITEQLSLEANIKITMDLPQVEVDVIQIIGEKIEKDGSGDGEEEFGPNIRCQYVSTNHCKDSIEALVL